MDGKESMMRLSVEELKDVIELCESKGNTEKKGIAEEALEEKKAQERLMSNNHQRR